MINNKDRCNVCEFFNGEVGEGDRSCSFNRGCNAVCWMTKVGVVGNGLGVGLCFGRPGLVIGLGLGMVMTKVKHVVP